MTTPSSAAVDATTGYYQAGVGLRLFRALLAATQALWPALAVRAATRLFCTPLPPRWLRRRRHWDAAWRVERWPFEAATLTVYTPFLAPHAPVALLVHGWGGHAGQMLPLAEALAAQGLRPVLVELPAHGRSTGGTSNLPQFARAIDYVAQRLQQEGHVLQVLAAHSLGATAAAHAVARGLPVRQLVLVAPAASPRGYTRYFAQVFGLRETTRAAMQKRIEAREGVLMRQFEPPAAGPRIAVPTLVVHDRGDRINAFADGQAYAAAIPRARLLATQGLGHRKLLKDDITLQGVSAFVAGR